MISKNPDVEKIKSICAISVHNSAKWLKDAASGDTYYWPAENYNHADVAKLVDVSDYTKGIAIPS